MIVNDLYSSAQYVVDEEGNKKAVLDWQVWKDIVSLLENQRYRETEGPVKNTSSAETRLLMIEPDAKQAAANQLALTSLRALSKIGDEREQRQTWAYLQQALDEDRLSNRPLYPQKTQ